MESQKSFAIIIAAIAAILVVLAGRSCTASINNQNKNKATYNNFADNFTVVSGSGDQNGQGGTVNGAVPGQNDEQQPQVPDVQYVTDLLGRVIGTVAREDMTKIHYEYVTDLLGRVISSQAYYVPYDATEAQTHIEYETDLLGRVVGTKFANGPAPTQANAGNAQAPTEANEEDEPINPNKPIHIVIN